MPAKGDEVMAAIRCAGSAVIALAACTSAVTPLHADDKIVALGRHLARECTSCHKPDGTNKTIPPLIGLEVDYFERTMGYYKDGVRNNPAMVSVAQSLDAHQIKALALYFASQPAPGAAPTTPVAVKKR